MKRGAQTPAKKDVDHPAAPHAETNGHHEPQERVAPTSQATGKALLTLSLGAMGVVYGDIGTSPLYAVRECFIGHAPVPVTHDNVLGVLSLIFWALILIVSVKYLAFVLRADNHGEGGILALMSLVKQTGLANRRLEAWVVVIGLFGAALLYGDGILTPAISVLSAAEGLAVFTPSLHRYVVPLTIAILVVLFAMQRRGTGSVGAIFGPITLVWFITIAVLGTNAIIDHPAVLAAINPRYAVAFFVDQGFRGFEALGAVFLAVTGTEALYADMGHFGRRPIRVAWFSLVLPSLVLCYFGQGALLLSSPEAVTNPFFKLAPDSLVLPLVVLATAAACIAAQAVISGTFSLTRQAVQLGFCPRIEIIHTSSSQIGQIYIPVVNWLLMVAVVFLVLAFKTSTSLAGAYGIAVSTTMVVTTLLAYFVARNVWKWRAPALFFSAAIFLTIDLAFLGANLAKLKDGGWLPLLLASGVLLLLMTWKRGRTLIAERHREASFPLAEFIDDIKTTERQEVTGTAVFMTGNPEGVPPALLHNLKHNKVLHERNVILTIDSAQIPHIPANKRIVVANLGGDFFRVVAHYGFMETPRFTGLIRDLRANGLALTMNETSFFLGRESLVVTNRKGMANWRKSLFRLMARNARTATAFFNLPPNRVVELGMQIEL